MNKLIKEDLAPFKLEKEKQRIWDVLSIMETIEYGFVNQKTGERVTDRDWIHHNDLTDIYKTNADPLITLKNKLGICKDQAILFKFLMNKFHPEDDVFLYAVSTDIQGHCQPAYCHEGIWFMNDSSWDREHRLHGPFDSQEELEDYLNYVYYMNHKEDNDLKSRDEVDVEELDKEQLLEGRVIKELTNTQLIKLYKDYLREFKSLSEKEVLNKIGLPESELKSGTPLFVTRDGYILNAIDANNNFEDVVHADIFSNTFLKKYGITMEDIRGEFTDKQLDNFFAENLKLQNYLPFSFGWMRINMGTYLDNHNPYIVLPLDITYSQHSILKDCLFMLAENGFDNVEICPSIGDDVAQFSFDKFTPDEIMDRIDTHYNTGYSLNKLNERLNEDTRAQLVSKSKNADPYKNTKYGKNRFERKKYSKVATTVKEFNSLDMNELFKRDILIMNVTVTGETGKYTVQVKMEGVVAEIAKNIKNNNNIFEFKTVIQAITKVFNSSNIQVHCSCDDFKYRYQHALIISNDNVDGTDKDPGPGKTGMANSSGKGCKHILLVLNNSDWLMKIASVIRNYINYIAEHKKPAFNKIIFPKLYGVPVDAAANENLVPEYENLETDKNIIDTINEFARNKGKFKKGTGKNEYAGKTKRELTKQEETEEGQ